jgi:hypothetical protein
VENPDLEKSCPVPGRPEEQEPMSDSTTKTRYSANKDSVNLYRLLHPQCIGFILGSANNPN